MLKLTSLKSVLTQMYRSGIAKSTVQELYRFIVKSKPDDLIVMNPNFIAIKTGLSHLDMLNLVVDGVLSGLFEMQWDINCPRCANIADHTHSLGDIHDHSYCQSCKLDFDNYADQNITISLSLHPNLFEGDPPELPEMRQVDKRAAVVTVLDLISLPKFRENFSDQIPNLDHSVKIRSVTLMFTDLIQSTAIYHDIGDLKAYVLIKEHFDMLFAEITAHSGGVIKTIGDAVMAVFHEPLTAVKVSFELQKAVKAILRKHKLENGYGLKAGLASGPALVVNMNKILDLFGTTVNKAARIVTFSDSDTIAVCKNTLVDTDLQRFLAGTQHQLQTVQEELKGIPGLSYISLLKID